MEDDEIDLLRVARLLASHWAVIALFLVLGGACGIVFNAVASPMYHASMQLIVVPERIDKGTPGPELATPFLIYVRSRQTIERAVRAAGVDSAERAREEARVMASLAVAVSKDGPIIETTIDHPDRQRAARLLDAIAVEAIGASRQAMAQNDTIGRGFLAEQLRVAEAAVDERERSLNEFRKASGYEAIRQQMDGLIEEGSRLRASRHENLVAQRALEGAIGSMAPSDAGLPRARVHLAAARAAAERLASLLDENDKQVRQMSVRAAEDRTRFDHLRAQVQIAWESYRSQSEQVLRAPFAGHGELKILARGRADEEPFRPRRAANIGFGAAIGLVAGAAAAGALELRARRRSAPAPAAHV